MQRVIDEPLPFRLLTLALLISGYFCIYRPAEQHLSDIQTSTHEMSDRASFGESLLARKNTYERAAERMRTELSGVKLDANGATMMATFLDDIEIRSHARNVTIAEILPQHDATSTAGSVLTLHVHGTYEPLIGFLNDLSNMHTLVRMDAIKLTRLSGDVHAGQTPSVDATINASLIPVQTHTAENLE